MSAKKKVQDAEAAEAEADRALHAARMAVREARNHVKILEAEAKEEYVLLDDISILRYILTFHTVLAAQRRSKNRQRVSARERRDWEDTGMRETFDPISRYNHDLRLH